MQWPITEEWRDLARSAMKSEGMTQSVIAERLGISQSTVQRILHGAITASEHVASISRMLRISPPHLHERPEEALDIEAWCTIWRESFDALTPQQRLALLAVLREFQVL